MADTPHLDDAPVRRLRARRDSTPVPTELVDAADALAVAFHAATSIAETDAPSVSALGRFWGVGRRPTKRAKDVLVKHGLWIEVKSARPDGGWGYEIRAVETRVTNRDLLELAMEYPTGTRVNTAGTEWRIDSNGNLTTRIGREVRDLTTETGHEGGVYAGQDLDPETGREGGDLTTETGREGGVSAGQDLEPETGREGDRPYIGDTSGISVGEIPEVGGSATPPADAGASDVAPNEVDWARQLVRDLPWRAVLRRGLKKPEADELAVCFRRAHHVHGLTTDQVQDYALTKLASADPDKNPVRWVVGAFQDQRLKQYAASLETEPLSDCPLSLPESAGQKDITAEAESHQQPQQDPETATAWCGDCRPVRTEHGKACSSECTTITSDESDRALASPEEASAVANTIISQFNARNRQRRAERRAHLRLNQDTSDTDDQQAS